MMFNYTDYSKAIDYLKKIVESKLPFEIIKKLPKRTFSQNRYLHLLLASFSIEFGYELEFTKQEIFKKIVNPDLFIRQFSNKKTGEICEYLLSSAKLNTKEMTDSIQRFRIYSSKEGHYLPEPNEYEILISIENEYEKNKEYL